MLRIRIRSLWRALCLISLLTVAPSVRAADDGGTIVREVAQQSQDWNLEESLTLRRMHGLPIDRLPELGAAKAAADAARAAAMLARLDGVDVTTLGEEDRLSFEVLRFELAGIVDAPRFRLLQFPVLPYTSPISEWAPVFSGWVFDDERSVAGYERLLAQVPDRLQQITEQLREQAAAGIRIPRPELDTVVPMLRAYTAAPPASPFAIAPDRLSALPEANRAAIVDRVDEKVRVRVAPAFAALADWLDGDYRKAAPEAVGLAQYPGGPDAYREAILRNTSLRLAPAEIHAIGVAAVDDLRAKMDAVRREVGFAGTLDEFRLALQADRRFFAATPDEMGARILAPVRRVEPAIDRFFLARPKAPYGVHRLAPQLEGGQTFGYYDPPTAAQPVGTYYYNASNLADRSLLWSAGLISHELVPGHHFQIALASENDALPPFRRDYFDNAYVEGWAEYAADLAGEMGAYADPYDRFGRLAMASFIASRLVVDTGMNALGWSRERAIEYLRQNSLLSDGEIRSETLRYAVDMPGQALGYRLGEDAIRRLRERAAHELGARFDIRQFHQEVLGHGALPLAVLEGHLERWLAGAKAR